IVTIATNAVGNFSLKSTPHRFIVDSNPPTAPNVTAPEDGAFVNNPQPTIRGTAEAGSTVRVFLDGTEVPGPGKLVDVNGEWSVTPSSPLAQGLHTVSVTATDVAGNDSPSSELRHFTSGIQRSHYGWDCSAAPASPTSWALLTLGLALRRRRFRSP
ncbi:Ig-like domain-containing protein, partial [Archangium violaceum]|uniref:Ig-like domain-containing protein n=1 Tax=Archangium violaceum TaxID=83451 RepID=UPI001362CA14